MRQACNACDTIDYKGELDEAGVCAECRAQEADFTEYHGDDSGRFILQYSDNGARVRVTPFETRIEAVLWATGRDIPDYVILAREEAWS